MKKKLISLLMLMLMPMLVLCGCEGKEAELNGGYDRFKTIDYSGCEVYVDSQTRVMYLFVKRGYGGGLTVIVNPDGTPMLYEGEL